MPQNGLALGTQLKYNASVGLTLPQKSVMSQGLALSETYRGYFNQPGLALGFGLKYDTGLVLKM